MARSPAETRSRILDAFVAAHRDAGALDLASIAARAGVSRSTVYRHFRCVEEMHAALHDEARAKGARSVEHHLAPALRVEPETDLFDAAAAAIDEGFQDRLRLIQLFGLGAGAEEAITAQFGPLVVELVAFAQRRGQVKPDLPAAALATTILSVVTGLMRSVIREEIDPRDASIVARQFLSGLRAT